MLAPEAAEALILFEQVCHDSGHELCRGSLACERGLKSLASSLEHPSEDYDCGREILQIKDALPAHDWSTPTLIGYTRHHLLQQPNVRGYWRATAITTALARLAERGLPADFLVRHCMGPALLKRILVTTSMLLVGIHRGECQRSQVRELEDWFALLETDPAFQSSTPSADACAQSALTGHIRDRAEDWLATAAIAHLIGWRLEGCLKVDVDPECLTIPAGSSAARWVYERSTETYVESWHEESRAWETLWITEPSQVLQTAGVPEILLTGRALRLNDLTRAAARIALDRHTRVRVDEMEKDEVLETIIGMLQAGALRPAMDLARRASRKYPADVEFVLAHAFCCIPLAPAKALRILAGLGDSKVVVAIDRACVTLMEGGRVDPHSLAAQFTAQQVEEKAWLWIPSSLPHDPLLKYTTISAWLGELSELEAGEPTSSAESSEAAQLVIPGDPPASDRSS